ncbi:hypothetical protein CVU82_03920 [Candidatus Falkowbacteria bacterium HGW-Falkowbacteria-1]|jgi:cbb3-type cytochrome oxidase subunit 3|uniref:Uncharacterized protein n=1 Tax=Candidatus Falkowbacteria bacterium HGW-Falkowbacteria-1 TaxID=2013768 RepID=A0A2N2E8Z6_9BACT|nr:MAG: hypothetical protein CVU82_03920 [Candidatus Falkowbacteria bacterium HGW-Falkowbacteria-1]
MIFKKYSILISLLTLFLFAPFFVFAQDDAGYDFTKDSGLAPAALETGHITSETSLSFDPSESISIEVGIIIQVVVSFIGIVFMILLVYGGILWMTAAGNDQQVDRAKKIITESIIGLVIIVSAYAISILVIRSFSFQ